MTNHYGCFVDEPIHAIQDNDKKENPNTYRCAIFVTFAKLTETLQT